MPGSTKSTLLIIISQPRPPAPCSFSPYQTHRMSEQREVRARGSTPCLAGLSHAALAKPLEFTAHLVLTFPSPYHRIPFFHSQPMFPGPESHTPSEPVGMQSQNIPTASISFSKSPDSSPRMLASMGFPVVFRYSSNTKPERERDRHVRSVPRVLRTKETSEREDAVTRTGVPI